MVVPTSQTIHVVPGQVILVFTDGIFETVSPDGTLFGIEATLDVVRANRARSACDIIEAVYRAVHRFAHGQSQEDDITMIVVKVLAAA
jgi:sigma-B regulation protein RsbU (phosphoserine phosphatase)